MDEAGVAHQVGKFRGEMHLDVLDEVRLERPILALVKVNQEGHDLAVAKFSGSISVRPSVAEALGCPLTLGLLAEIIDMAVQFQ